MKTIKKLVSKEGLFWKEYEDQKSVLISEENFEKIYNKWVKRPNTRKYDKNGATIFEFNVSPPQIGLPPPVGL